MQLQIKSKFKNVFSSESNAIIKSIFKNSYIFILFSLLNVLLPIFICLIAAAMTSKGAFAVMGIGYVTAFQLAYCQIGFTFGVFASFLIFNKKTKHFQSSHLKETFLLTFLYGFLMVPLYVIPSWIYSKYASAHINTLDSINFAYNYIWTSSGFIFLTTLRSTLVLIVNKKDAQWKAIVAELFSYGLMIIFCVVFSFYTNLNNGLGLGIGLTFGSTISCIVLLIYCWLKLKIFTHYEKHFKWKKVKYVLSYTWRQSLITIAIQIFKAITLFVLSFSIPNAILGAVPLDYQMARLVWYNVLYLIPFLFTGMTDAIYDWFSENKRVINRQNGIRIVSFVILIIFLLTIIFAVGFNFAIQPLTQFYVHNGLSSYDASIFQPNSDLFQPPLNLDSNTEASILKTVREKIVSSSLISDDLKTRILNEINNNLRFKNLVLNVALNSFQDNFTKFNTSQITEMLILPHSWSYLYVSVYCLTYPVGVVLNAFLYSITKTKPKVWLLVIAEGIAIAFIVTFGVNLQTSEKFYLMDAWSFPLSIVGVIALLYLIPNFFIQIFKYENQKTHKHLHHPITNE